LDTNYAYRGSLLNDDISPSESDRESTEKKLKELKESLRDDISANNSNLKRSLQQVIRKSEKLHEKKLSQLEDNFRKSLKQIGELRRSKTKSNAKRSRSDNVEKECKAVRLTQSVSLDSAPAVKESSRQAGERGFSVYSHGHGQHWQSFEAFSIFHNPTLGHYSRSKSIMNLWDFPCSIAVRCSRLETSDYVGNVIPTPPVALQRSVDLTKDKETIFSFDTDCTSIAWLDKYVNSK